MGKLFNRAKMTVSGTPGTGTITLLAAAAGFQSFASAGVANGDVVSYVIEDGTSWEVGQGTYTSSGTTLARTTVQASSNAGSAISATSSALVFITAVVSDFPSGDVSALWTAWKAYTPTITATTGTVTTASATGQYLQIGKIVFYSTSITVTTNGTGSGLLQATLPVSGSSAQSMGVGRVGNNGKMVQVVVQAAAMLFANYDNTYPVADGFTIIASGVYQAA